MGCDIHFYVEVKTENGWELYAQPRIERNYTLFTKLADVRGEGFVKPIAKEKGLPDDISYLVRKSYEENKSDNHNMSYITRNEIVEFSEWLSSIKKGLEYDILNTYLEGNSFAGFYKCPDEKPDWIEDIRFVFWFDN